MSHAAFIFLTLLVLLWAGVFPAEASCVRQPVRLFSSGLLKTVTEGAATITRTYDERGRLKTFTTADGYLIQYRYDANNNLTRLTYPGGKQVHYTYNARNLLATVTDWSNRVTTYTYDRLGRLTGITRPNGTSATMAYDTASQLLWRKEHSGTKLISYLAWQYDAACQTTRRFRAPLVQSGWQHPSFSATYDDDNRLATINGQPVTHDADGNMTRGAGILPAAPDTLVDLTYNSRNQLTSAGLAGSADRIDYTYDSEGRRRTITDSTGTTRDVIDPNGSLSRLLVRHHPDGSKTYYVHGLGLLYEVDQAEKTKTHHYDQVGSTILRTDDTGKVIGKAEYSAYGIRFWSQGDMATPFLYNGQSGVQTDPNGLLNMRARYYSPYLMRFLNADPSGFSGGSNWFAYADGNPISLSDPFGLQAAQNDFFGQVMDRVNGLADSLFGASRDPQGAAAAGVDRLINGAMGGGATPFGSVEPLKSAGVYQEGSFADQGGDFMAMYLAAASGYLGGRYIESPKAFSFSPRNAGATLGEQFLIADDALVHFSPRPLPNVRGIYSDDAFAFQFGEIRGFTGSQASGLIGPGAAGGAAGGTRFIHILDDMGRIPELRPISGAHGVSERVYDGGVFNSRAIYKVK